MTREVILASFAILTLLVGFTGSSFDFAFAQEDSDRREEARERMEERKDAAREKHDERKQEARDKLEERKQESRDKVEQRKQEARDKLEQRKQEARKHYEERQEELRKDRISDEELRKRLEEKREELREKAKERKAELRDTASDKREELRIKALDKREDLREKAIDKKQEIKERIKDRAIIKAKESMQEKLDQRLDEFSKERYMHKIKIDARTDAVGQAKSLQAEISSFELDTLDDLSSEDKERAIDDIRKQFKISKEKAQDRREDLQKRAEYKTKLIQAKIDRIGEEQFRELKAEYREKIKEKSNERFVEIKSKIKSKGLVDQVEDGTYYGVSDEIPENDRITYTFSFDGDAVKYSDQSITKSASGDIILELADLGDSNAKLRVIGGQFSVSDSDGTTNVWDVSFGRARVLINNDALQMTINAIDLNGKHGTFRMHADTEGVLPLEVGEVMDVHATKGRTSVAGAWALDFVGTITVDDVIPIEEFDDVEGEVQASIVADEIAEEATEEYLDEIDVEIEDIFTDEEIADLTEEEIEEIEETLEAEILAEIEDEIADDLEDEIEQDDENDNDGDDDHDDDDSDDTEGNYYGN